MPVRCADHRENARRHAMRRAWRRLGIAVGEPGLRVMETRIWHGKASWVRDCNGMCQVYRLKWRGREIFVVFDINLETIVTFLPKGWAARERSTAA